MGNGNQQALRDQYQQLHDKLVKAVETCTNADLCEALQEQEESIDALITALNRADIQARTGDFQDLIDQITSVNTDLGKLKDDIAKIGDKVAILGKVVEGIDSAISAAAKVLPI
jgi:septal ring factor EnvC (AmiA/AmiB activator)